MYNNYNFLYNNKHTEDFLNEIKRINPIFNNSTMKQIVKLQQQLTGLNNPMVKNIVRHQQQMSMNNPLIKQARKLQPLFNNIYHSRAVDQALKNQRQMRKIIPSFNVPTEDMRSVGVIPNFYKLDSIRKLKNISPYFDYIKNIRSSISKLSQINYAPLKKDYLNTQSAVGIPGNDYTPDQVAKNKTINHRINASPYEINKNINKIADEAATKAALKTSREFNNQKTSGKDNNVERYKYITVNYNGLSTHNWWFYIDIIIGFINNVDQTCHTLNDVIMLINNYSPDVIRAVQAAVSWLHGMGY